MSAELSTDGPAAPPLDHVKVMAGWLVLVASGLALTAFLWNHKRFDLDISLNAVRGWPRHSLYDYRDPKVGLPFNYPPFAAVLMLPLRALDREVVDKLWLIAGLAASGWFLVLAARMAPRLPSGAPFELLVAASGSGVSRCSSPPGSGRSTGCWRWLCSLM